MSYKEGRELSRDSLTSAGAPARLILTPETPELKADGDSLCFIKVEAADANGNLVPYEEVKAAASVTGAASLLAFGTGRPCTEENYTKSEITLYKGAAHPRRRGHFEGFCRRAGRGKNQSEREAIALCSNYP